MPFLLTIGILLILSLPAILQRPKNTRIYAKDGFVCVAAAWILLSAFGALPFMFSGAIPHYVDAFFETVSGFTTTGASILREIESLPRGILFWRSFTHWIGGMGVLVFVLAILPSAGGQTMHLMRAEVPGPTKGKLVPKMRQTAIILYGIYFALTILLTVLANLWWIALALIALNIIDRIRFDQFYAKKATEDAPELRFHPFLFWHRPGSNWYEDRMEEAMAEDEDEEEDNDEDDFDPPGESTCRQEEEPDPDTAVPDGDTPETRSLPAQVWDLFRTLADLLQSSIHTLFQRH